MSDAPQPSSYLADFIFRALDHGIHSIDDECWPLVPFMVTDKDGEREITRFVTDRLEESVEQARLAARNECQEGKIAVIAYDGFLTSGGKRTDAIFVQASDSPTGPTLVFAQRYRTRGKKVEPIGDPAYIHYDDSLFPG